jgi:hypothetical protein
MFKSRADESPKAGTVSKESKKSSNNLDRAIAKAAKAGKKLTDSAIIRIGFKGAKQITSLFSPRGSKGKVTARGISGKVGSKADTNLSLQKIQKWTPAAAGAALARFESKSGKQLLKSVGNRTGANGKKFVSAVMAGLRKRAAGKNVAKLPKSTRPTKKK